MEMTLHAPCQRIGGVRAGTGLSWSTSLPEVGNRPTTNPAGLRDGAWTKSSTRSGVFDGEPNQVSYMVERGGRGESYLNRPLLLIFAEEDGDRTGVRGRDEDGKYATS